jgi:proteasome lid subunit RPN8/RPN11
MTEQFSKPPFQLDDGLMVQIEQHAYSQLSAEVGGVLMGTVSPDGTSIQGFIPALSASAEQVTLTFTHDVWEDILKMARDQFPDLAIVGWYHTHPTFGIFLSEYDLFIQQNFFNNPGHFALVIDPVQGLYGWFANTPNGEVQEIASGQTHSGPRRSVEPMMTGAPSGRAEATKFWGVGVITLALGVGAGASFTLSQTPPDVSQTLAETRAVADAQALIISDLRVQFDELYADRVFTYAPQEKDTLLSIAQHFYRSPLSGVRTLQSANGISSLDQLPDESQLIIPNPTRTFLADFTDRDITWRPLSPYNNDPETPGDGHGAVSPDAESEEVNPEESAIESDEAVLPPVSDGLEGDGREQSSESSREDDQSIAPGGDPE